jgi:P4 family phage/plasmid primase-like protien
MELSNNNIYTAAFHQYKRAGLDPLPIPYIDGHPTKGPTETGWPTKAANGEYAEHDFERECSIGNLHGGVKHISDLDLDALIAVAVGREVMTTMPPTFTFGHDAKPRSHYIYACDKSLPSAKIKDPVDGACIVEYRCVKENGERGHQTVFPPSLHYDPRTGKVEQIRLEDDSLPEPAFVEADKLRERFKMIGAVSLLAKHFPVESERHNTILALAGVFACSGMSEDKATMLISLAYRHSRGYNGDRSKAESDVKSVYQTRAKKPDTRLFGYPKLVENVPKIVVDRILELLGIDPPEKNQYHLTDTGNGRRLVDEYKADLRYCVDDKEWYIWDGVRWRKDVVKRVRELAKGIADDIRPEATNMTPPTQNSNEKGDQNARLDHEVRKEAFLRWANQSENADRVSKTIKSAESDPRITCFRSDFDRDAHLLNCPNCVVDLRTGAMLPHDRKYMMSNLSPVEYNPRATHPVWEQSIKAFTRKHVDLLPFLKRLAGYTIQGDKTEERILLLYGPGNAGKGTFMDWFMNALGPDYACAMDANSVLKQKRDSAAASGDIARLEGKRLVVVSEIEKGSRLQESFMKQASGNDAMVARGLYQSEREFRPTHQFWFQTNYRPGFDSTDSGNKRRYIEVPFDNDLRADPLVTFDSKIKIKMRNDPDFLMAVLAWAVAGCIEWHQHGLEIPKSVQDATDALFAHNDFLRNFLTECCTREPGKATPDKEPTVSVKMLRLTYEQWCEDQGEEPAQGRTFNRMMEERGYERRQNRVDGPSIKAWIGIRLKTAEELMEEPKTAESQATESELDGGDQNHHPAAVPSSKVPVRVMRPPATDSRRPSTREVWKREEFPSVFNGGVEVQ